MVKSVIDYISKAAMEYPDKLAYSDAIEGVTYSELKERTDAIACNIRGYMLSEKVPIAILLDTSVEAIKAFWGVTKSGNIYMPLDTKSPDERISAILDAIEPKAILTNEKYKKRAEELCRNGMFVLTMQELDKNNCNNVGEIRRIERNIIDTDPLYIICTSGSTGIPKGVVIPHRAVIDFVEEASEAMGFSSEERFASEAPFYFDASVADLYCTLRNAATMFIMDKSLFRFPIKVLEFIKEKKINAIYWVPSALVMVANLRALGLVDISCLRKVMFCGEVMPVKQLNMWRKEIPNAVFVNYYGPSETTYASTYYIIDREFRNDEVLPIGKAAANTGVLVLGEDDCETVAGEIGELCIRGSGVGLGYYNDREKTKTSFVQNPLNSKYREIIYRTGDLVKYNEKGELLYVGRKDSQIKHMGYRIELGEIENAVMAQDRINNTCCLYDENKQKIILVYSGAIDSLALHEVLKTRIPGYMLPDEYVKLKAVPMNANGKIDRVLLRKQYVE